MRDFSVADQYEHMEKQTPGPNLYAQVRAGFVRQGTSFHRWCLDNDVTRQNATLALLGGWRGPKARALLRRIVRAAGVGIERAA